MSFKFNPFTGNFDNIGNPNLSSGGLTAPQIASLISIRF